MPPLDACAGSARASRCSLLFYQHVEVGFLGLNKFAGFSKTQGADTGGCAVRRGTRHLSIQSQGLFANLQRLTAIKHLNPGTGSVRRNNDIAFIDRIPVLELAYFTVCITRKNHPFDRANRPDLLYVRCHDNSM